MLSSTCTHIHMAHACTAACAGQPLPKCHTHSGAFMTQHARAPALLLLPPLPAGGRVSTTHASTACICCCRSWDVMCQGTLVSSTHGCSRQMAPAGRGNCPQEAPAVTAGGSTHTQRGATAHSQHSSNQRGTATKPWNHLRGPFRCLSVFTASMSNGCTRAPSLDSALSTPPAVSGSGGLPAAVRPREPLPGDGLDQDLQPGTQQGNSTVGPHMHSYFAQMQHRHASTSTLLGVRPLGSETATAVGLACTAPGQSCAVLLRGALHTEDTCWHQLATACSQTMATSQHATWLSRWDTTHRTAHAAVCSPRTCPKAPSR